MTPREKVIQVALYGQEQLRETYARYQHFVPAGAFIAGMVFDIFTVARIDDRFSLIQQAVYLSLATALLVFEVLGSEKPLVVPKWLAKAWHYREEALHFLLGSLLSAFTILFFKSSSLLGSFLFFLFIIALLVGNEFSTLRSLGLVIRSVLLAVCLTAYFCVIVPIIWGRVGYPPFLVSLAASLAVLGALYLGFRRRPELAATVRGELVIPYAAVIAVFLLLYAFRLIPPVPVSLTHVGVYRSVEPANGGYVVQHTTPGWKFWRTGDQSFAARPGDRVYVFFSIFSPGGFRDNVRIRWIYKDPKAGWKPSDAVPVAIAGGREAGWRGFSYKANYQPGRWQVRIETSDEREIGRINLDIYPDPDPSAPRDLITEQL